MGKNLRLLALLPSRQVVEQSQSASAVSRESAAEKRARPAKAAKVVLRRWVALVFLRSARSLLTARSARGERPPEDEGRREGREASERTGKSAVVAAARGDGTEVEDGRTVACEWQSGSESERLS